MCLTRNTPCVETFVIILNVVEGSTLECHCQQQSIVWEIKTQRSSGACTYISVHALPVGKDTMSLWFEPSRELPQAAISRDGPTKSRRSIRVHAHAHVCKQLSKIHRFDQWLQLLLSNSRLFRNAAKINDRLSSSCHLAITNPFSSLPLAKKLQHTPLASIRYHA